MKVPHVRALSLRLALAALLLIAAGSVSMTSAAAPAANASNPGSESVDLDMVNRIRAEGLRNSHVMEIMSELTDRIGSRLTGSPNMKRANEWTRDKFTEWGLANSHLEAWGPFGRGWSEEASNIRMVAPDIAPLIARPKAWTPGTNGVVRAAVVRVKAATVEDLAQYKGQLAGKIVVFGDMREVKPQSEAAFRRYDDKGLDELSQYQIAPDRAPINREEIGKRIQFQRAVANFWKDENVAAVIEPSRGDGGTVFVQGGGPYRKDDPNLDKAVPSLVMAIEHYGRISRLLDRKVPVELELDVRTKFYDDAETQYDTIAEIPGTDKAEEVVMLGAHLDSWHGGTGATDNGAGSAVMMEAMRILKTLGVKPRRTIRIGLWSGEEEGLLGSRGYVSQHFGGRPENTNPAERNLPSFLRRDAGPINIKPEQSKVSGYFNVDNGTGKLRGIYLQENAAVRPIFEAWMEPFRDLGMNTISMRNTGGTDHLSFDAVGIPGFQFIQDPMEYDTRTHHSNMDVYERLQREDLMQAATIVASFVYNTAMRDQMLPRKPLPKDTVMAGASGTPAADAKATPAPKKGKKK